MNWKFYRNLAILSGTITIGSLFANKINYHNNSLYNLAKSAQTVDVDNAQEFLANALETMDEIDDILIKKQDLSALKNNIEWYLDNISVEPTKSGQYIDSINYGLANRFKDLAEHNIPKKSIRNLGGISFIITALAGFYSEIKHINAQDTFQGSNHMNHYNN